MRNIFEPRKQYKPFEYNGFQKYCDVMTQTMWVHTELNFTADVNDYLVNLDTIQKEVFRRSLLGISQIEVGVKTFWGDIYKFLPKSEFQNLGMSFGECETRHSEAYSQLLTILGFEGDFNEINQIPVLVKKDKFIVEHLSSDDIIEKLFFFVIGIENASLFSQFANILAYTRFGGLMKNVSNIISWSSADEDSHKEAGIDIINIIFEENPQIKAKFTQEYVNNLLQKYIQIEIELLDWIYELGELTWFTKTDMINFMKYRLDAALVKMEYQPVFKISNEEYKPMMWFEEEIYGNTLDDFFSRRPVDYTKHNKSFDEKSIWED